MRRHFPLTTLLLTSICQVSLLNAQAYPYAQNSETGGTGGYAYVPSPGQAGFNPDPDADIYTEHGVPYPGIRVTRRPEPEGTRFSAYRQSTYSARPIRRISGLQTTRGMPSRRVVNSPQTSGIRSRPYITGTRQSAAHRRTVFQRRPSRPIVPRYSDLGIQAPQKSRPRQQLPMRAPTSYMRSSSAGRQTYRRILPPVQYSRFPTRHIDSSVPMLSRSAWQTIGRQPTGYISQGTIPQHAKSSVAEPSISQYRVGVRRPRPDYHATAVQAMASSRYQDSGDSQWSSPQYQTMRASEPPASQYQTDGTRKASGPSYQSFGEPQPSAHQDQVDASQGSHPHYKVDTVLQQSPPSAGAQQSSTAYKSSPLQYNPDKSLQKTEPHYKVETARPVIPGPYPRFRTDAAQSESQSRQGDIGRKYQGKPTGQIPHSAQTDKQTQDKPKTVQSYPRDSTVSGSAPKHKGERLPQANKTLKTHEVGQTQSDKTSQLSAVEHTKDTVIQHKKQTTIHKQHHVHALNHTQDTKTRTKSSHSNSSVYELRPSVSEQSKLERKLAVKPSIISAVPTTSEFVASADIKRTKLPRKKSKSQKKSAAKKGATSKDVIYKAPKYGLDKVLIQSIIRDYNLTATGSVFLHPETRRRNALALKTAVRRRRPRRRGGRRRRRF